MKASALRLALILFVETYTHAAANDTTIKTFWSPHHHYCCRIQEGKSSGESILFESPRDHKSKTLLTTERWVDVSWSPDDTWFCVEDDWDPDSNRLHVYHVLHDGTTEEIWTSFEVSPDSYWKVLGWRMNQGTIHVQCEYAVDYNYRKEKGSLTKDFFVPIFLPKQVTMDEQFAEAEAGMKKSKNK